MENPAMRLRLAAAMLAAAVFAPMMAAAQSTPMFQGLAGDLAMQRLMWAPLVGSLNAAKNRPQDQQAAAAPAVPTQYRASPEVSVRVRRQFAEFLARTAGPEAGQQVAQALERTDPVQSWAGIVAENGLKPGDTADAMAGYWVLNWAIANRSDGDRGPTLAVREQVRRVIAANPAYADLTEAQRQEMAEVLMLNFLVQHAAYGDAVKRGDQALLARLGEAAVTRFRNEMGIDLRRLQLTERGFVSRG
jgi:hypothetical protein